LLRLLQPQPKKKKPNQPRLLQLQLPSPLTKRQSLLKATPKKPSLLRSNPHRIAILNLDDCEIEFVFDDAIHRGYSRPRIEQIDADDDLPEHIKWRLFLSRQLALLKYKEKWA
jgi:hypothetical protein